MLVYQKSRFNCYYCIKTFSRSKTLEKKPYKVLFSCTYNDRERHVTCEHFTNAASRAKTNVMLTSRNYICYCARTDDVSFCDGPIMLIRKTAKLYSNSTWFALLIHGFVPVKTWLLIAAFYAIITNKYPPYLFLLFFFAEQHLNVYGQIYEGWLLTQ